MNNWIVTATGQELDLQQPQLSAISIGSIAHALSQINRFTGHASRPYSVAEHSLLVAEIAKRELGLDVHGQFAALMHDAHEAFCGDLSTPGKRCVGDAWRHFEGRLEHMVRCAFALNSAAKHYSEAIKRADLMALAAERRDLLPKTPSAWAALSCVPIPAWVDLRCQHRRHLIWHDWSELFLLKYTELDYARNQAMFGCTRHDPAPPTTTPNPQKELQP